MQPGFFSLSFHSALFMALFGILLMLLDVCTGGGEVRFQKRGRWGMEGPPLATGHAPLPRENTMYQHEPAARVERCAPMGSREGAPSLKLVCGSPAAVVTSARRRSYPCLTGSRRRLSALVCLCTGAAYPRSTPEGKGGGGARVTDVSGFGRGGVSWRCHTRRLVLPLASIVIRGSGFGWTLCRGGGLGPWPWGLELVLRLCIVGVLTGNLRRRCSAFDPCR